MLVWVQKYKKKKNNNLYEKDYSQNPTIYTCENGK